MEEVLAHLGPALVGVLGQEEVVEPGLGRHGEALRAVLGALLVVVGLDLGHRGGEEDREPEAGGATGGRLGGAAQQERRGGLGERLGGHLHRGAVVLEGLTGPRLQQGVDAVVHELAPVGPGLAVGGVLLGPVADAADDAELAAGDEVEHRDVLGDAQRVVQGHEQGGDRDRDVLGAPEDGAGHDQRRGAPAVEGAVVLLERHHAAAQVVERSVPCRAWRRSAGASRWARGRAGCS